MKKWLPALLLVCGLAVVTWFYHRTPPSFAPPPETTNSEQTAAQSAAISNALARQDTNTVAVIQSNFARVRPPDNPDSATAPAVIARAGPPSPLEFTNFNAQIVLERMRAAVRQYGDMFGGNPVGNNAEITAALKGNNPRHINFLNADFGMRLNDQGELLDPWGTPYFFHQLSGTDMEIHSAGPDKMMWTDDDLVVH